MMEFDKLCGVHVRRLSVGASKQTNGSDQVQAPAEKGANSLRLLESMHGVTAASTRDLIDSYFVINSDTGRAVLKSPIMEASLNPSWRDLNHSLQLIRCARNCTLELWWRRSNPIASSSEQSFSMAFSRTLDSKSLVFVASKLGSLYRPFQENTLLLEFEDGLYQLEVSSIADADKSREQPQPDASKTPKESFDLKFCEAFMGMQEELSKVRESIGTMLKESDHLIAKCDAISDENIARSRRSSYLRNELRMGLRLLEIEKLRLEDSKKKLRRRKNRLYYSALDREQSQKGLLDVQEDLFVLNVTARETCKFKGVLEKGFIATLKEIYPINALRDDPNVYLIRRVWLPHSEFINVDEERIATALGWTAHLVTLLALYMEIPLRYPINPMSSRSMILDRLSLHGPGNMEFPLFMKGQDKLRFEYGVFLLNKNIEQLMAVAGVVVKNLRNTLPNLKSLIDAMSKPAMLPSENDAVLKIPVSYRVIDTPVAAPPLDTTESFTSLYSRHSEPILALGPYQVEEQQSPPSNPDKDAHSLTPSPFPTSGEYSPEFIVEGVAVPSNNTTAPPTPSKSQLQKSIQFLNKSLLDAATASLTSSPHSSPVPRSVNVPLVAETQQAIVLSSAKALPVSTTTVASGNNNSSSVSNTAGNSQSAPLPSHFGPESNVEFLKSVDAIRSLPCSSPCSPSPTVREDDSDSSVGSDDGSSSESSGAESFGSEGLRLNAASESGTVKPSTSTLGLRLKQLVIEVPSATASGENLMNNSSQPKRAKKPTRPAIDTTYTHQNSNTISSSLSSTGSALDNFRTPTTEMSPTRGAFWRAVAVNVGAGVDADVERDSVDDAGNGDDVAAGSPRNSSLPARPSMLGTLGWNSLQQPMSIAGSMFMNPFNLGRGSVTVVEAGGGEAAIAGENAGEESSRRS